MCQLLLLKNSNNIWKKSIAHQKHQKHLLMYSCKSLHVYFIKPDFIFADF